MNLFFVSDGFGGGDAHYRLVRSRHTPMAAIREKGEGQGAGGRQNGGGRELIRMTVMVERLSGPNGRRESLPQCTLYICQGDSTG